MTWFSINRLLLRQKYVYKKVEALSKNYQQEGNARFHGKKKISALFKN